MPGQYNPERRRINYPLRCCHTQRYPSRVTDEIPSLWQLPDLNDNPFQRLLRRKWKGKFYIMTLAVPVKEQDFTSDQQYCSSLSIYCTYQ
jgi:hypothetical protein